MDLNHHRRNRPAVLSRPAATLALVTAGLLALTCSPAVADDEPLEDLTPPDAQIVLTTPASGWFTGPVSPIARAVDDNHPTATGVREVRYTLTGASTGTGNVPRVGGGPVPINADGVTRLTVEAWDGNDNYDATYRDIRIDSTAPVAAFDGRLAGEKRFYQGEQVGVFKSCSDAVSGVSSCEVGPYIGNGFLDTRQTGTFRISVVAEDAAGHRSTAVVDYEVVPAEFTVLGPPTITGVARPGHELVGDPGTFAPFSGTSTCRWLRDGQPVPGSAARLTLTGSDGGTTIRYECTLTKAGFTPKVVLSDPVTVIKDDLTLSSQPVITGTAVVGGLLTAGHGTTEVPGTAYSYRWYRNGTVIAGAAGRSYRLTPSDAGRRITVAVAASATGYNSGLWTSGPTGIVQAATPTVRASAASPRKRTVRVTASVTVPGVRTAGTVTVKRGSRVVARATLRSGRATLLLRSQRSGVVRYTVTYGGAAGVKARTVTVRVRVR